MISLCRITVVKFYSTGFSVHWHLVFPYYHWPAPATSCSLHHSLLNPLHRQQSHFSGFVSTWCAGFVFPHHLEYSPLSASTSCPSANLFMASPWQQGRGAACSGNGSSGVHLEDPAQPFLQSSKAWPEHSKHHTACNAVIPREPKIMEASELFPFKAMCS